MHNITKLNFSGMGCNHLHAFSEIDMKSRGYDPIHLVDVDSICKMFHLSVENVVELCGLGAPRYWFFGDSGVEKMCFVFHPAEFLKFLNDLVGTPNQWSRTVAVNKPSHRVKKARSTKSL